MTTTAQPSESSTVHYQTLRIQDVDVFYRDAGPKTAPVLLLLHGFPTSSNMFRNLIPRLAKTFRVIAPDYPGYGFSGMPDRSTFTYSFENMTNIVEKLTETLGLDKYSLYVMDYGAPIGYRLALRHPEKVSGFVVQNGNAYEEGLRAFWDPIKKYWLDASAENRAALGFLTKPEATRWQYENGVGDVTVLDPTTWTLDQLGLDRSGNADIQLDMLYDYRTNVPLYPEFQAFFRKFQPPMLIVWGKNDYIFPPDGATPYKRDLPHVETHLLDTGHFALETHGEEIAFRIEEFLGPFVMTPQGKVMPIPHRDESPAAWDLKTADASALSKNGEFPSVGRKPMNTPVGMTKEKAGDFHEDRYRVRPRRIRP